MRGNNLVFQKFAVVGAVACCFLFLSAPAATAGERMTNADVVEMSRAGIAPDIISAAVKASGGGFDLSTRAILDLNQSGVNDAVIKAMLDTALTQPASGVQPERLRSELANITSGVPEKREAALAWFVANRESTIPELRSYLSEANPANRAAAAVALGRIGDTGSVTAIRNLLTDPAPETRKCSALALHLLDDQSAYMAAEQALARQINPLDGYIRLLGHARQTQSAGTLGQVLIGNTDSVNRVAAAWALGEIGRAGVAGRPALEKALTTDTDPEVRREAAVALAKFHDSAAAQSLEAACRLDPAVRKTTLAALADYPESVGFLVSVISLNPDQISADETDTARSSLARLTGQDFGLDAQRWNEWFAANASLFPGNAVAIAPSASAPAALSPLGSFPESSPAPRSQGDIMETWSIIADSSIIPTAPMPGESGLVPAPGSFPTSVLGADSPWGGATASAGAGEAAGTAASFAPGGSSSALVPSAIPDLGVSADSMQDTYAGTTPGGVTGSSGMRTWSSDPDRVRPPAAASGQAPSTAFQPIRPSFPAAPGSGGMTGGMTQGPTSSDPFAPGLVYRDTQLPPAGQDAPLPPPATAGEWSSDGESHDDLSNILGRGLPVGGAQPPATATADPYDDWSSFPSTTTPVAPAAGGVPDDPYSDWSTFSDSAASDVPPGWELLNPHADGSSVAPSTGWHEFSAPEAAAPETPWDSAPVPPPALPPAGETAATVPITPAAPVVPADPYDSFESFESFSAAPETTFPTGPAAPIAEPFAPFVATDVPPAAVPASVPADPEVADESFPLSVPPALAAETPSEESADAATAEQPGEAAMADALIPAPEAASETVADDPGYRTDLFVEPEPGQFVITDDNPQGAPMMAAPSATPTPTLTPTTPAIVFSSSDTATMPASVATVTAEPVPGDSVMVEAAPDTTTIVEATPTPAATSAEPFRSSSPAIAPPTQTDSGLSDVTGPQSQYLAPPPPESSSASDSGFFDPSKPLPPVRPEGTIAAPAGKDVPLLGDKFF